ncbi:Endonuclease/exonuclease/phosphatase [Haematococcus lacustris]
MWPSPCATFSCEAGMHGGVAPCFLAMRAWCWSDARCRLLTHDRVRLRISAKLRSAAATFATTAASMEKVHVRHTEVDRTLSVSLVYDNKLRTLNRAQDEPLDKALARLLANIAPAPKKNKKSKREETAAVAGQTPTTGLSLQLFYDQACTRLVPGSLTNLEAWGTARRLVVGPVVYSVQFNAPTCDKLAVPARPMVGFPLLARALLSHADQGLTAWSWARRQPGSASWNPLACTSPLYTPVPEDQGCLLRATCTPAAARQRLVPGASTPPALAPAPNTLPLDPAAEQESEVWQGLEVSATTGPVEGGPAVHAATVRQPPTPQPAAAPAFRVATYNLLADQYAGSTFAQQVLFNYCPPRCLEPEYRRQLILAELQAYQADILCLQEVDDKLFREFLEPHLALRGYTGHYTNKQGRVREGSATFWRCSRFTRLQSRDILLRDAFRQPLSAAHAHWQPMLEASPALAQALQQVTTIAQATVLLPVAPAAGLPRPPGPACPPLCVVNTHLFYHPYAPHIRSMHTAAILEEAAQLLAELASPVAPSPQSSTPSGDTTQTRHGSQGQAPGPELDLGPVPGPEPCPAQLLSQRPALLFCGDLNSDLNDGVPGVVELLQSGRLPASHWDWHMGASFKWGMDEEEGTPEQQARAPQPPNTAIAARVAEAQALTAAAASASAAAATTASGPAETADPQPPEGLPAPGPGLEPGTQCPPPPLSPSGPSACPAPAPSASEGQAQAGATPARPLPLQPSPVSVVGLDLVSPFGGLRSADDLRTPFTNYTSGYKALLDYVWLEPSRLQVVACAPTPSEQELGGFIPSATFPSDHLAVVFDLAPQPEQKIA